MKKKIEINSKAFRDREKKNKLNVIYEISTRTLKINNTVCQLYFNNFLKIILHVNIRWSKFELKNGEYNIKKLSNNKISLIKICINFKLVFKSGFKF